MSFEDPTQRLSAPAREPATRTTAALPRPLDLSRGSSEPPESPDETGELSLDEIFAEPGPQPGEQPRTDEAPTWTAMPVIPVRREPPPSTSPSRSGPAATSVATSETAQRDTKRTGPTTGQRLRSDAATAWKSGLRRSQTWLSRDDNGLILMTAIVAVILILVVLAAGS